MPCFLKEEQFALSIQNIKNTWSFQMNLGESIYDPLLMSLVKSSSIIVDEGDIFKPWDMDCLCVPFRRWMCKTKDFSAFERGMVVGARRTSLCQELQRCWGFHAQQFPAGIKKGPPPKGHPANMTQLWEALESTWASFPVECLRRLVGSIPQLICRSKTSNFDVAPNVKCENVFDTLGYFSPLLSVILY